MTFEEDQHEEIDGLYLEIQKSIEKAFLNSKIDGHDSFSPSLIYNDQNKNKKVIMTLKEELLKCDTFAISVAFITEHGLQLLKETFHELLLRGVKGKILTTDYLCFTEPKALKDIRDNLPNIEVKMYKTYQNKKETGFHTKGYLIKQGRVYKMIIGSSNLTAAALSTSKEWNTKIVSTHEGEFGKEIISEFDSLWEKAVNLNDYLNTYEAIYNKQKENQEISDDLIEKEHIILEPNFMQIIFCRNFKSAIENGKKRGLLISSTGTGKTYASAFALREVEAKKVLFIAHRSQLLTQAIDSYKNVFPSNSTFGLLTGDRQFVKTLKNVSFYEKGKKFDFLMSTSEMLGKNEVLHGFSPDEFDYIVIDEVHRAGSDTYEKIVNYFKPKFLLGMTATPERTEDESLIYEMFDHNILFEIRLNDALDYDLLCPFHYYGITDKNGVSDSLYKLSNPNLIISDERVNEIIKQSKFYGYSGDRLRGLIFVSSKDEGKILQDKLNERGLKTKFVCGESNERERKKAISLLEEIDITRPYLDFIITVDIFNEGVDIPEVNQIIMLRPTKSSIIFVQQLGRGLRKWKNKDFVVIIDFIGNYDNNYMIPKAFASSGDKEELAMFVSSGYLPGVSTIEFDEIAREKIYKSIHKVNLNTMSVFKNEYLHLKNKLNRIPNLMDFLNFTDFDPARIFISKKASCYLDFLIKLGDASKDNTKEVNYLSTLTRVLYKGLRKDEALFIKNLIDGVDIKTFIEKNKISDEKLITIKNQFQCAYFQEQRGDYPIINNDLTLSKEFNLLLENSLFKEQVDDIIEFSLSRNEKNFKNKYGANDFSLFSRYTRDDVSILLNQPKSQASTLFGYRYLKEANAFPIFINYIKSPSISEKTRYEDILIDSRTLSWYSRHGEKIESKNMKTLINQPQNKLKVYLFIRKSIEDKNDSSHYFLGEIYVKEYESIVRNNASYVHFIFDLKDEVREDIYNFLKSNIKGD